jgi:hypothetical protein
VPPATLAPTVTVSTLVPAPGAAIVVDENLAVTPAGKLDSDRLTAALKGAFRVVVIVVLPLAPAATSTEVGARDKVSGGALTTARLRGTLRVLPPAVPTTFNE